MKADKVVTVQTYYYSNLKDAQEDWNKRQDLPEGSVLGNIYPTLHNGQFHFTVTLEEINDTTS